MKTIVAGAELVPFPPQPVRNFGRAAAPVSAPIVFSASRRVNPMPRILTDCL